MLKDPVRLSAYDPRWPRLFETLSERIAAGLAPLPVRIEHVGSTSVPGLPAKPIIDLDVIVDATDVAAAIERLSALGYAHKGDGGLPGREAFRWPQGEVRHHVYLCTPDAPALLDHLSFRDRLRARPDLAQAYAELKRTLAERFATNRDAYQAGKAGFVEAVIRQAQDESVT